MTLGEKIKLIAFDVDGTLTKGYSWHRLHKAMGIDDGKETELIQQIRGKMLDTFEVGEKISQYYRRYHRNNRDHMIKVLSQWEFNDGVEEMVAELRKKYKLAVLSGGPHLFVRNVAERLDISIWRSTNHLLFDKDGSHFVRIWVEGNDVEMKIDYLKEIGRSWQISSKEMMFVGDSFSDLGAFTYVEYPVLYEHIDDRMNTEPVIAKLKNKVKFVISHFSQLFDILNINEESSKD